MVEAAIAMHHLASASGASDAPQNVPPPTMSTKSKPPISFLDLAPELRNHIYEEAFPETACELNTFRIPALLQTCRQIRTEAMTLFSDRTELRVHVGSDFYKRMAARLYWYPQWLKDRSSCFQDYPNNAGDIYGNDFHGEMIETRYARMSTEFKFRRVTWKIYDSSMDEAIWHPNKLRIASYHGTSWIRCPGKQDKMEQFRKAQKVEMVCSFKMTLKENGELKISKVKEGDACPPFLSTLTRGAFAKMDVQHAVDRLKRGCKEVASRDGFEGFTVAHLGEAAKRLRFEN